MKFTWILAAVLSMPLGMAAQSSLPAGTLLSVSLDGKLNVSKVHAGETFRAEVMQNIPGTAVRRRDHVLGHIVQVTKAKGQQQLELTFDAVEGHGQRIPLKANLRALASFNEVQNAQVPDAMASRGITPEVANTQQIGGDMVYRDGGPVVEAGEIVGQPTPYGVLVVPQTQLGQPCRGVIGEGSRQQAFWVFSANACGVYGYSNINIEQAGRSVSQKNILLSSDNGKLVLYSGTALLLRVKGSQ